MKSESKSRLIVFLMSISFYGGLIYISIAFIMNEYNPHHWSVLVKGIFIFLEWAFYILIARTIWGGSL